MQHFVAKICSHMHIFVTKWCIVVYGTGALWNLRHRSIVAPQNLIVISTEKNVYIEPCCGLSPEYQFLFQGIGIYKGNQMGTFKTDDTYQKLHWPSVTGHAWFHYLWENSALQPPITTNWLMVNDINNFKPVIIITIIILIIIWK